MTVEDAVRGNLLGGNSGNLIYAYSVFRAVMREDVEVDVDRYRCERNNWSDGDVERINATYDAYLIPLADAFRDSFIGCLDALARNVARLTIPCVVVGVGLRAPLGAEPARGFKCDDAAARFMRAVLEKSAAVGVRGERTGAYLGHLGFREGSDFTVIGCPSMYGFGRELDQRPLALSEGARVSVNFNTSTAPAAMEFLVDLALSHGNGQYVAQRVPELATLYAGVDNDLVRGETSYPTGVAHPLYARDRVRFYTSAASWIEGMRSVDLSIGGRLHGTVAAILGGAPVVFAPCDTRTEELREYHRFPTVPQDDLAPGVALEDVLGRVDLQSHLRRQGENFDRYLGFMHANGIATIFDGDPCRADAPLDARLAEAGPGADAGACTSVLGCSEDERARRVTGYVGAVADRRGARLKRESERLRVQKEETGSCAGRTGSCVGGTGSSRRSSPASRPPARTGSPRPCGAPRGDSRAPGAR